MEHHRDLAVVYDGMGKIDLRLGSTDSAQRNFTRSLELLEALLSEEEGNNALWRDVATTHEALGRLCLALGDSAQSLDHYQACRTLREELVARTHLSTANYELSVILGWLGDLTKQIGEGEAGNVGEYYEQALQLAKEAEEAEPKNVKFKQNLALAYDRVGTGHDIETRVEYMKMAYAIREELSRLDPDGRQTTIGRIVSYLEFAQVSAEPAAKATFYDEAIRVAANWTT